MIKRIESRDIFVDDVVSPFNDKRVVIVTTEEYVCTRFGIDLSENRDKNIDTDFLALEKATGLFESIKNEIKRSGKVEHYYEISPRLDAVIIPNSYNSLEVIKDYIRSEFDIVSE